MEYLDIVGYAASGFVLLSFIMKKIKWLRIVNTVGCALFVAYGFMFPETSWPIVFTNVAIILVNLYYLFIAKK